MNAAPINDLRNVARENVISEICCVRRREVFFLLNCQNGNEASAAKAERHAARATEQINNLVWPTHPLHLPLWSKTTVTAGIVSREPPSYGGGSSPPPPMLVKR